MKNINANEISKLTYDGKIIIFCYGIGCMNCKIMQPIVDKLEPLFPDISFYCINVDLHPHILQRYKITFLPTIIPFRNGQDLPAIIGVKSFDILKKSIEQSLKDA